MANVRQRLIGVTVRS